MPDTELDTRDPAKARGYRFWLPEFPTQVSRTEIFDPSYTDKDTEVQGGKKIAESHLSLNTCAGTQTRSANSRLDSTPVYCPPPSVRKLPTVSFLMAVACHRTITTEI